MPFGKKTLVLEAKPQHKENSALASAGKLPRPNRIYKPRILDDILIKENELGEWVLIIGKEGGPMIATDVEVMLWKRLQEMLGGRNEIQTKPDR